MPFKLLLFLFYVAMFLQKAYCQEPVRGTKEWIVVEKAVGNVIYTTDGRQFKTDRRRGYVPRQFYREYQLQGKRLKIEHQGTDLIRKNHYINIEKKQRK